jgi:hypothetical protein
VADQSQEIGDLCRRVLDGSWREGVHEGREYGFTVPSPTRYPWQWYWDSCFHAIVRRRFSPERAQLELETLLSTSRDGFIGHISFWGKPLNLERAIRYNVARRHDFSTSTIQPPLLAWAWRIAVGDPSGHPGIEQHHRWLSEYRDLDGDGLLWLVQPDESGLDASPKFDNAWGPYAQGRRLFPFLIRHNRRLGFDARRIAGAGRPVVCEVVTNTLWSLSRLAMGQSSATPAMVARLWHEPTGRFLDDQRNARSPLAPERRPFTWDTLAPLVLPDLPEEIGHRLVREHLLDPAKFWDAVPLASVALNDPAYSARDHYWGLRRYWRGPSWVNSAWLAWLGLQRLGYAAEAQALAGRLLPVIAREGLREYYQPRTGVGMGAQDFGWTSLCWELAEPDPRAAGSYL